MEPRSLVSAGWELIPTGVLFAGSPPPRLALAKARISIFVIYCLQSHGRERIPDTIRHRSYYPNARTAKTLARRNHPACPQAFCRRGLPTRRSRPDSVLHRGLDDLTHRRRGAMETG